MSKRLMPTYLVNFLKEIYDGTIPSNFGKRMVSRQFIARVKELYETLGGDNPSDYSRRMVNEYLIKFFNEIEIVEYTDDDVLMTKTIPSDLVYPACRIDAIGGMSYKSENLVTTFNSSTGTGHTFVDGILTSSSSDSRSWNTYNVCDFKIYLQAGTYKIKLFDRNITTETYQGAIICNSSNTNIANFNGLSNESGVDQFTISTSDYYGFMFKFKGTIKPMLVSGTTTPTEFKEGFEGIRDSIVTSVKSYDSNNNLIDTYTIPSEIQALEGYGRGINSTVYNNVDFASGKYVKKVGVVDLGTLTWVDNISGYGFKTTTALTPAAFVDKTTQLFNGIMSDKDYTIISTSEQSIGFQDKWIGIGRVNQIIFCKDLTYANATEFKAAMDGVLLYYELATPVETTITEQAPLLECEDSGTIVFENTYNQDMPNEVTTWIKEN